MNASNTPSLQHPYHEHGLILQELSQNFTWRCYTCKRYVEGGWAYHCIDCNFFLHKSCAESPPEIQHPSHPQHPLELISSEIVESIHLDLPLIRKAGSIKCSLCFNEGYALRSLSVPKEDLSETRLFEHVHEHPMRLQCVEGGYRSSGCHVCKWPLRGLAYASEKNFCPTAIHKACAELIGHESKQPIHPQHPLVLSDQQYYTSDPCSACLHSYHDILLKGHYSPFVLHCDYCQIHFHARCALGRPTLKHQRHEHSLRYIAQMGRGLNGGKCNVCYENCRIDFYTCVTCNYNLHYNCKHLLDKFLNKNGPNSDSNPYATQKFKLMGYWAIVFYKLPHFFLFNRRGTLCPLASPIFLQQHLPPFVKHERHIHPMVLRDRVVDDFYDEQYCDLCETTRHPEYGVYYCDECRCAAHIDCVIPTVNTGLRKPVEDLTLRKLNEEIADVEAEMEAVKKAMDAKLEELMRKIEWLKTKRHEIARSRMHAEAEQDRA
ncbi:hypothetical protein CDL15_Pgr000773 [Punica granatum]|uniref:DC1 domain-containing protein n=2 Tax=Punica granatum TaxID=22663 RepID=A0A218W514_PUNGR|nr:hypothetical protein CDL15_Pgr000773 [Punica granatum]